MKRIALLAGCLLFVSCGGGGGGGSANFNGNYLFRNTKVSDTCNFGDLVGSEILYNVRQDGDSIVIRNIATGVTFSGNTIGDGWIASASGPAGSCLQSVSVVYGNNGPSAIEVTYNCPSADCSATYSSNVSRE